MRVSRLPDEATMVRSILDVYERATLDQVTAGYGWYRAAQRMVEAIAEEGRSDPTTVARILAALSPRNPWRWNVADAYVFVTAASRGVMQRPTATTFNRNAEHAWAIANGEAIDWSGDAPKVRSFVSAVLGNEWAVVVDVWAMKVATGLDTVRKTEYQSLEAAYRRAASQLGLAPCHVQAITWLVAQEEGLGSERKGRHDLTYKKGTPDVVREMLEGER